MEKQVKNLADQIYKELKREILELRLNPKPFSKQETQDQLNNQFICCETYFIGLKFAVPS